MKKLERTNGWEDSPLVSSKNFDAEFDELDEEIIELDDEIIELPANGIEDHEEPAFDVEILDTDRPLDLKESEGKLESEEEFLLEEDLLKELPFFQDQPEEAAPTKSATRSQAAWEPGEAAPELFSDLGEEAVEPPRAPEPPAPAAVAAKVASAATIPAAFMERPEAPSEPDVALEEFMAQMESRLLDTVRELVAARLPEIVRTVLREEIERLQTDRPTEH